MFDVPPDVRIPSKREIKDIATEQYLSLTDEEASDIATLAIPILDEISTLDGIRDPDPKRWDSPDGRSTDRSLSASKDPYNAFVTECQVSGAVDGILDGYDIGVKDNVSVAGVRMTCGSKLFQEYVPGRDATIVTRLLAAGGDVVGKLNMSDFAFSGSGELSANGPILNPRDPDHLAGGSSGGSAAAVVSGDVDIAVGTDQGGSVRLPAAICGCVGLKPTYGLVPYDGIVGLGPSFDHVGPLATSVEDCAVALAAMTGAPGRSDGGDFDTSIRGDEKLDDLTLGRLEEGFGETIDEEVAETVDDALGSLEEGGFDVVDLSVPYHHTASAITTAVTFEELAALFRSEGVGYFRRGFYDVQFADHFAMARRTRADDLPITVKLGLVVGQYLADHYHSRYYFRAQNLRPELAEAYDRRLSEVDALVMPTAPHVALESDVELTRRKAVDRGTGMTANTGPFNMTGHPAISLPCGTHDGLPVGLMVVGERNDDGALLRVARRIERALDCDF